MLTLKELEYYKIKPGSKVKLSDFDANDCGKFKGDKEQAALVFHEYNKKLVKLQDVLYAQNKHKVLIIIQAMDTGGKDSTIRHNFTGINPQGVKVISFKAPCSHDLQYDFLYRIHQHVPSKGEIVIFNRSHYEDVLIVRIHNLIEKEVWKKRYTHINNFEKLLTDEGTTILKLFLYIDKNEQKKRLEERLIKTEKNWKFDPFDLKERELWDEYMEAYETVFEKTSTKNAPWYVIPANKKWYRNVVVSALIVDLLEKLKMNYPSHNGDFSAIEIV